MSDHQSSEKQKVIRLERQVHKLQIYMVVSTAFFVVALCVIAAHQVYANSSIQPAKYSQNASFGTITVKRINVVENNGTRRLVIAGASNMPPPIADGKVLKRAISPAGILFYNDKGNERGGITVAPRYGGEQSAIVFDYNRAEAIALVKAQHGKDADAGLYVMAPPPATGELGIDGKMRIKVQTVNGNAQIILNDTKGRPRLRLSVPKSGSPSIELLDAGGKITRKISSPN